MSTDKDLELIWEIEAIAKAINRTRSQTFSLLSSGAIQPAKKVGGRWVVDRTALKSWFRSFSKEAA